MRADRNVEVEADADGFSHIYPINLIANHEIHLDCWCFPERRMRDSRGALLKSPVFVHNNFVRRGNA